MVELRKYLKLYAVTDAGVLKEGNLTDCVEQAILGGVTMVQYREKNLQGEAKKREALAIQALCRKYRIPFIVNDDVALAKEIQADGVHLGLSDMDIREARILLGGQVLIGATAKTASQAKEAVAAGADYIGSGAVFGSTTKLDAKPMQMDTLKEIVKSVDIPVVAIGGISGENVMELQGTKIAGVAVVSGIFAKEGIREAASVLAEKVECVIA